MKRRLLIISCLLVLMACHPPSKQTIATATLPHATGKPSNMDTISQPLLRLKEKLDQGIDFTASGQEPFWSLEIDFSKQLHFKTASGFDISTPVPEGVKAMDANVTRYRAVTDAGELIVQLQQLECINSMSGQTSEYTVTVDTKSNSEKTYNTFKGCGSYTADYRINDIWVLERINDVALKPTDFTNGLPQLEINLAQKKVFGHTGCNNLNGAAEVQGKKIVFGPLLTTRMACPNLDFENRYINTLQQRAIPYKIEGLKLQLHVRPDSVFIYRKVD